MTVEITNWAEVKNQFGLELAKLVSRNLKKEFSKNPGAEHLEPMYDREGYALFEIDKQVGNIVYYLFTGTAK